MATITLNAANGTWSVDSLNSTDFANARITTQTSSRIVMTGANGMSMEMTGNFTSSVPTTWTVNSITINTYGTPVITFAGIDITLGEMAYSTGSALEAKMLAGADVITSNSATSDYWRAHGGNDKITLGNGDDTIDGDGGIDQLTLNVHSKTAKFSSFYDSFSSSYSNITVNTAQGADRLYEIELLKFVDKTLALHLGTYNSETLNGDTRAASNSDIIFAGAGDDTIQSYTGNDKLYGHEGSDSLKAGAGNDLADGGTGNDTVNGEAGRDRLFGGAGNDSLDGGAGNDFSNGGTGDDVLTGGAGSDRLIGGVGNDTLTGGRGDDSLIGGQGKDLLFGHTGNDVLTGGARKDVFLFHKNSGDDTITDFSAGVDLIHIGRGANRLEQLQFTKAGDDVVISFQDTTIRVEDITVADLRDADNFLF